MKPFNDWKVYSQIFISGIVPVLFSVIIIGSSFFGGLYELKNDAIAAQLVIHDLRSDSYLFTSELREYLINLTEKKDSRNLLEEIGEVKQRLKYDLSLYAKIAKEGEAANAQSLSEVYKIYNDLESIELKVNLSDIDIYKVNDEIEDLEHNINETFKRLSFLVEKEINFEMALLSGLVIGASIISFLGGFFYIRKLSKKIVNQILILKTATSNFGDGNLSDRAEINSINEMGQLSSAFNKMADDLQKTLYSLNQEITRRNLSEDELKKSHLELEAKVRQRTDELKDTYQQLAHAGRLTALGEMATGIAHEIRQPLAIIDLANLSLKNYFAKKNTNIDLARSSTLKISEQVKRADKIIENMRSFARTDSSDFQSINLMEPVEIAASFFKEQCKLHQIDLSVENKEPLPLIYADSQKIEQIVINLISNARYAIEAKTMDKKDSHPMQIRIKSYYDSQKKDVILEVIDNGFGMNTEEKENCLNPFFTTKQVGQGTGLGLSIVYNIVQEIRGRIEIESKKDTGSTFRIMIPAKEKIDG